jgi:hypothetical protein
MAAGADGPAVRAGHGRSATAEVVDDVSHAGPRALLREEGVPNVNHQNQVTAANHDDR